MTDTLNIVEYGSGAAGVATPVVILHGLFGSSRNWRAIAQRLGARHRVLALDAPNHGGSPWSEPMNYESMAQAVRGTLLAAGCRNYALIGHSMGGKTAMMLALQHPAEVARLVVVDIAPVPTPPRHLAYVKAMRTLDLAPFTRRSEVDAALALAVPEAGERGFLQQNLESEAGRFRWRINLPVVEQAMPQLVGFPDLPRGTSYAEPALFVGGRRSDYLRPQDETEIRGLFPKAEIAWIENAGHWLHAEQPEAFLSLVTTFLEPL